MVQKTRFRMLRISRRDLEKLSEAGKKTDIDLVGILVADDDVTPDLIERTVASAKVCGRIIANSSVKQALLARGVA